MKKTFSLNKSRQVLHSSYKLLKQKRLKKHPEKKALLEKKLESLEDAIFQKDSEEASSQAQQVLSIASTIPEQTFLFRAFDFSKNLFLAVVFALLIRQFWFELYEVPTGSMRPTIREQDQMLVSKTTFGLHIPFKKRPIAFKESSLTRGSLVIFTVSDMNVPDSDTKYFGFIPGKKRYVKRCIGKPGDSVYFYGGRIYIVDKDLNPVPDLSSEELLEKYSIDSIYHCPFLSFSGATEIERSSSKGVTVFYKQMNQRLGKIDFFNNQMKGSFFNYEWKEDKPALLRYRRDEPVSYADLFGIGNYGMVRILTPSQALEYYPAYKTPSVHPIAYLEIYHTPNTSYPSPWLYSTKKVPLLPTIHPFSTLLPLRKEHIHLIKNNLTTSRFIVSSEKAFRYSSNHESPPNISFAIDLPGIPDGCYEYEKGQAYKINWGGIRKRLPTSHPLMDLNHKQVIQLFNFGIVFSSFYSPANRSPLQLPYRYAFYNKGNLYLMDAPVFLKKDPALMKFIEEEKERAAQSSEDQPYVAFIDQGEPPSFQKDKEAFTHFITKFGIKVPEGHVMVLGDNYPISADSREFGFVPINNLLGTPVWKFWPFGESFGKLPQPPIPKSPSFFIVNGTAAFFVIWLCISAKRKRSRRLFK
ncbi:signal peptidase I [Chlamydiifrater phoenicopteri]|uniref:signal peptidase I n=1 Tax=Chlamydiifrater phoenicopteri TaxID=2681469 RepID=UPI001BD0723E|nr:signal peptidase I [Chlamydiifrater phoenicopteri]